MNVEWLLFALLSVFLIVVSGIYWVFSEEVAGTTMILLSGGLALIVGYYLWFTARRMEARPEDRPDAEISEGSGEMGFFSPHSWWPIIAAGSFAIAGFGLVTRWWLLVVGLIATVLAAVGFLFEYYVGINRSQGQTLSALEAQGEQPTAPVKWLAQ